MSRLAAIVLRCGFLDNGDKADDEIGGGASKDDNDGASNDDSRPGPKGMSSADTEGSPGGSASASETP